jgi:hypothetical protein
VSTSRIRTTLAGGALLVALAALPLLADSYEDRRSEAGARLFRAMLAADRELPKKVLPDGRLLVVFFYADDRKRALDLARTFAKLDASGAPEPIQGLKVVVETTSDERFAAYAARTPGGVFIAEAPSSERLSEIVRYGIAQRRITFSPFEGHVESGVLGGLSVEAQVRPYVNLKTLGASGVALKEFFLKVAKPRS